MNSGPYNFVVLKYVSPVDLKAILLKKNSRFNHIDGWDNLRLVIVYLGKVSFESGCNKGILYTPNSWHYFSRVITTEWWHFVRD